MKKYYLILSGTDLSKQMSKELEKEYEIHIFHRVIPIVIFSSYHYPKHTHTLIHTCQTKIVQLLFFNLLSQFWVRGLNGLNVASAVEVANGFANVNADFQSVTATTTLTIPVWNPC